VTEEPDELKLGVQLLLGLHRTLGNYEGEDGELEVCICLFVLKRSEVDNEGNAKQNLFHNFEFLLRCLHARQLV